MKTKSASGKAAKINIEVPQWDDTYRLISWWDAERVKSAQIMVVGAGALGNEVLKNLALLNVGYILIVDFDTIEYSNLSRSVLFRESDSRDQRAKCEVAAERVREINPNVHVQAINGDIMLDVGLGIFRRMDVIIGCLDNRLARLHINRHCFKMGKTWVDGAIENLSGQMNVYQRDKACYECQLTHLEWAGIQYRQGCPDIAQRNANYGRIPTTPISASVVGALQVAEALKIVFQGKGRSLAGYQFKFDGMESFFLVNENEKPDKEDCVSHSYIADVLEAPTLSANSTVGETLAWLGKKLKSDNPIITLPYEVILELTGNKSEVSHEMLLPKPHFSEKLAQGLQQVPDELMMITRHVSRIDQNFEKQDVPLRKLGIPPLHILEVETEKGIFFVELTGDQDFLFAKQ